jgi:hypothetical protein
VSNPVGGTVALDGNGDVVFTPDANFNGTATFDYSVSDGFGGTSTSTVTVDVASVNDAPVVGAPSFTTSEDTSITVTAAELLAGSTDLDGDALSVSGVALSNPAAGSVVDNLDGTWTFTPTADWNGALSLDYSVSDGTTQVAASADLTVSTVNDAPIAVTTDIAADEDVLVSGSLVATDVDVDALTFSLVQVPAQGDLILNPDGSYVFEPSGQFEALYEGDVSLVTFVYSVSDGVTTVQKAATLSISGHNETVSGSVIDGYVEGATIFADANANGIWDAGEATAFTGVDGAFTLIGARGELVISGGADASTLQAFKGVMRATEGSTVVTPLTTLVVALVDAGATLATAQDTVRAAFGISATVDLTSFDPVAATLSMDPDVAADGKAVMSAGVMVQNMAVQAGSVISGASTAGVGQASLSVIDALAAYIQSNPGIIDLTNAVLLQNLITTGAVNEGLAGSELASVNNAADEAAAIMSASATALNAVTSGAATGADLLRELAQIAQIAQGASSASLEGSVASGVQTDLDAAVSSYTGASLDTAISDAIVSVGVSGVNNPAIANADAVVTSEDVAVTITASSLLANDTDVDGDTLSLASVSNAVGGKVVLDVNGNVVFTPDANFNGEATFDYSISDGNGGTSTSTVTVDVVAVNDAPVSGAPSFATAEDTLITVTAAELQAGSTDLDGDALSVSGVSLSDAAAGSLVDNLDGTWTFTPTANWNGTLSLDYSVSDGTATVAGSAALTVSAVNDNPVTTADSAAASEDTSVTITAASLLTNDTDVDGDTMSLSAVSNAVGGTVALDGNGDVVFTPDVNFNGEATFDYSVSDGNGGTSTSTVTVVVSPEPQQNTGMPVAVGSEFQVNTYTAGAQRYGIPISLSDGRYVISWQSMLQDGSSYGVYGQVFDADGTAVGSEFRVNTYTLGAQGYVSLSASQEGGFLATWESYGQDGGGYGIYAQRFDNLGSKVGDEFLVNTTTAGSQNWPDVTTLNNGDYVIVWHSFNQDGDSAGIYAQRLDGTGTKVGAETLINTTTIGFQAGAEVDALADGGYVIVWQSPDVNGNGVFGQRFDASGNAVDGEFQVNTSTTGEQRRRDVTGLEGGGFVVVWEDEYIFNQRACARVFDANGSPIGDEFQVNTSGVGVTSIPQVTSISDGGFVVVWKGNDSDASGVFVQRYDALGNRVGDELQVNTYEVGSQGDPFITELASGDLLVSWESLGQDGAQGGIYGQRLSLGNVGHLGTENADQLIGDNDANTLTGNGGDDTLWGLGGRDVLSGGTGDDILYGGSGDDTYQIARGDGQDLIVNIGEGGSADTISYSTGVNHDQLWFTQNGNDLVVGIIGTTDQITVSSWYANASNQVSSIETADGQYVTNAMVNNLVSAMAAMTPPPVGQTNLNATEHTQLDSVIAANWQPRV